MKKIRRVGASGFLLLKLPLEEFDELIAKARKKAKQAGMKKSDVAEAIAKVRAQK